MFGCYSTSMATITQRHRRFRHSWRVGFNVSSAAGDFRIRSLQSGISVITSGGWKIRNTCARLPTSTVYTKQDLVGFGNHGVWIAISNGPGFDGPQLVQSNFANTRGAGRLSSSSVVADVNKDDKADIVGFGYAGVWISHSTGTGLRGPVFCNRRLRLQPGLESPERSCLRGRWSRSYRLCRQPMRTRRESSFRG